MIYIQGEGKLEMEGVRPQRYPTASGLAATGEPHTFGERAACDASFPCLSVAPCFDLTQPSGITTWAADPASSSCDTPLCCCQSRWTSIVPAASGLHPA